jgi:hypothetical protein
MKKILFAASALVLGLTLTGSANAADHHHGGPGRGHVVAPYFHEHGVRFGGGYYYRGRDHHHWERCVWDAHYCRYQYYDPYLCCWYYWDAGRDCYYPCGW